MNNILKPPTNYTGSKHNLINELVKYFPQKEDVKTFYDVFCGGLSVSMNVDYDNIIANDVITPLIEFYKILKSSADSGNSKNMIESIQSKKISKTSQEEFNSVRKKFNETKDPYLFFALVSSCTNNMMRFNKKGEFNQTFGKRTINDNTLEKVSSYMTQMSNKNIMFTNMDFSDLLIGELKPTNGDFVYLDPPYGFITEAGYNTTWSKKEEDKLHNILDELTDNNVKFALSGVSIHKGIPNPYIDRLSNYKIININHNYEKVARRKNAGESQEILVTNYYNIL